MKAGIGISISFGLVLILGGCSKDRSLFGTWKGDRDWKSLKLDSEEVARHLAAIDLELSADGSFKLRDVANYGGSWVQTGSGVDLRVETILNRPIEQQQESVQKSFKFEIRVENGRMFYKNLGDTQELELKKELKP